MSIMGLMAPLPNLSKDDYAANITEAALLIADWSTYLPNKDKRIPDATADPITPATLGPMACINK